jgi:hypothetical protein
MEEQEKSLLMLLDQALTIVKSHKVNEFSLHIGGVSITGSVMVSYPESKESSEDEKEEKAKRAVTRARFGSA